MSKATYNLGAPPTHPAFGFGVIAPAYLKRGYKPIPLIGKVIPVGEATGYRGVVTPSKVENWRHEFGYANTGLRFELGQIGLDVDEPAELAELEARLGALPPTYSSTSRGDDSERRTYVFRVPLNTYFREKASAHIDTISLSHRYLAVAPSVHPITGQEYAWYAPDGTPLGADIPLVSDWAELPEAWVKYMTVEPSLREVGGYEGHLELDAWLGDGEVTEWTLDLIKRIESVNHVGHSGLFTFISEIRQLRELHEGGLAQANRALLERHLATATPSRENTTESLTEEFTKVWRWILTENFKPDTLGKPLRLWVVTQAELITAKAKAVDEFWGSRPILAHVQRSAYQTVLSPWAVLGALLQRQLMDIPYNVHYQSARGKAALNSLAAFVGVTGQGKSLTQSCLDDAFSMSGDGQRSGVKEPGSGEGLIDAYRVVVRGDDKKPTVEWSSWNHALLFGFDEVGAMDAKSGKARAGSTVLEVMKSAESGQSLSRVLAGGNGTELPAKEYRFVLFVNIQPTKSGGLFDEAAVAGGLPGRFLWFNTQNENAELNYLPGPVTKFSVPRPNWKAMEHVQALEVMNRAHLEDAFKGHRGNRDELDSHAVLTRAKVAVALMALDGRTHLVEEDWELAGVVMEHSNDTREAAQKALKSEAMREVLRKGKVQGIMNSVSSETEEEKAIRRVALRIQVLRDQGRPETGKEGVKQRIRSDVRHYYEEACELIEKESAKA